MAAVVFFPLAALLVMLALAVVLHPDPVKSALALVGTLFLLAVFFVFLSAEVVAALQVIVYAGAIMVLFLFVIMLLSPGAERAERRGLVVGTVVGGLALVLAWQTGWWAAGGKAGAGGVRAVAGLGGVFALARSLFTDFLLPFELTSVLLLVAIVGAVVLAKRRLS